jgi:hypothetical protein
MTEAATTPQPKRPARELVKKSKRLKLQRFACNCAQIHTLEIFRKKHVRRYSVRRGPLCATEMMKTEMTNYV